MKKIRITISVLLVLTVLALTGCTNIFKPQPITTTAPDEEVNTDDHDGWDGHMEYDVKKYEVEDNAFEVEGELNLYKYDSLPDAEKVIDVFNSYYDIDLKVDEETHYENGYGNWFWDNGEQVNPVSASVSMSSKTGKFSFCYAPDAQTVKDASKLMSVDVDKWDEKVTEFVNQFEFVTGKLKLDSSVAYNDLYYPVVEENEEDSKDLRVWGRRFFFVSEDYSKQTVNAQDGLDCYVECGNSDISTRDIQYFVVTIFNDGTIISADNNITKAKIISDGAQNMIDESNIDKLLEFFTSTVDDDTFILKRVYIDSYANYFGYPEIIPILKVEYYFKSNPEDVQTTEVSLEGFYN